ncbi:MAG: DUF1385 domain-containing protein [Lachnospiraceae bacterium]|nr:DUF1385 domain-containing protein [Lachnospiraceae bacterium]
MKYSGLNGQTVLEGVAIRSGKQVATATRKPNGDTEINVFEYKGLRNKNVLFQLPFLRGIAAFFESVALNIKVLNQSIDKYDNNHKSNGNNKSLELIFTILACILAVAAFIFLPMFLSDIARVYVRSITYLGLIEVLFRILLMALYYVIINQNRQIKRMYMFLGASNKVVNCIDKGHKLSVKNAMKMSSNTARNESAISFVVFLLSTICFMFINNSELYIRIPLRIVVFLLIAAFAYEFIYVASLSKSKFIRGFAKPGMLIEKMIIREPSSEMISIAIAAVEEVYDWEKFYEKKKRIAARRKKIQELRRKAIEEEEKILSTLDEEDQSEVDNGKIKFKKATDIDYTDTDELNETSDESDVNVTSDSKVLSDIDDLIDSSYVAGDSEAEKDLNRQVSDASDSVKADVQTGSDRKEKKKPATKNMGFRERARLARLEREKRAKEERERLEAEREREALEEARLAGKDVVIPEIKKTEPEDIKSEPEDTKVESVIQAEEETKVQENIEETVRKKDSSKKRSKPKKNKSKKSNKEKNISIDTETFEDISTSMDLDTSAKKNVTIDDSSKVTESVSENDNATNDDSNKQKENTKEKVKEETKDIPEDNSKETVKESAKEISADVSKDISAVEQSSDDTLIKSTEVENVQFTVSEKSDNKDSQPESGEDVKISEAHETKASETKASETTSPETVSVEIKKDKKSSHSKGKKNKKKAKNASVATETIGFNEVVPDSGKNKASDDLKTEENALETVSEPVIDKVEDIVEDKKTIDKKDDITDIKKHTSDLSESIAAIMPDVDLSNSKTLIDLDVTDDDLTEEDNIKPVKSEPDRSIFNELSIKEETKKSKKEKKKAKKKRGLFKKDTEAMQKREELKRKHEEEREARRREREKFNENVQAMGDDIHEWLKGLDEEDGEDGEDNK